LPKYPPSKEIDAKLREEEAKRYMLPSYLCCRWDISFRIHILGIVTNSVWETVFQIIKFYINSQKIC
jgi:hypothetical protein